MGRLSDEQIKRFIELRKKGYTYSELAKEFKVSIRTLITYAKVLGLTKPRRCRIRSEDLLKIKELRESGLKLSEIAEIYNVSRDYIASLLSAMGVKVVIKPKCPEIPKEVIEKYVSAGVPKHVIASELNVSIYCLNKLMKKYGVRYKRREVIKDPLIISERILNFFRKVGRNYSLDFINELRTVDPEIYNTFKVLRNTFFELITYNIKSLRIFKISYVATASFSVLPKRMRLKYVTYLEGSECDVIKGLMELVKPGTPKSIVKRFLSINNAPEELINKFYLCVGDD